MIMNINTGTPVLTQANHPDDVDTTALGLMVLNQSLDIANLVMDKMLQYLSPDGIFQVRRRPHRDCNQGLPTSV